MSRRVLVSHPALLASGLFSVLVSLHGVSFFHLSAWPAPIDLQGPARLSHLPRSYPEQRVRPYGHLQHLACTVARHASVSLLCIWGSCLRTRLEASLTRAPPSVWLLAWGHIAGGPVAVSNVPRGGRLVGLARRVMMKCFSLWASILPQALCLSSHVALGKSLSV